MLLPILIYDISYCCRTVDRGLMVDRQEIETNIAGGVRHEIRPIRMRYLWSDFRAWEEPSSEVYMVKFSIYSKLV